MFSIRAYLVRSNICRFSTFLSTSKSLPKNFSTLRLCNNKLLLKNELKIFLKPDVRNVLFKRNVTATVVQESVANVQKQIGVWLLICSGMVYGAITLGGYTRVTESGLSMVNWRFIFESYPKNNKEWEEEFKKYQEYPEFKLLKKDLTLEEFKKIWQIEYIHRTWGRYVGIIFFIPAASFWLKGCFKPKMKKLIAAFGTLICLQGLLGWYMVQSGLEDRFHKETDIPRVSQYRLAAHLGMALTLMVGLSWTAFELLFPPEKVKTPIAGMRKMRMLAHSCKGLVFLTALSGAFMAGLDGGLVYNSFPKMGDKWIPDDLFALSPLLKNFTENPTTTQFVHRILGITTFSTILGTWFISKKYPLPKRAGIAVNILAILAVFQVIMGITTLVHHVPNNLAVSHQSGSVLLLVTATLLSNQLKFWKHIPK